MDAVKFIKEHGRMCRTYYGCDGCLARNNDGSCKFSTIVGDGADEQIALLEEWSSAHPPKTRQSVFLEQWPDTQLDKEGNVIICPIQLCKGEEFNKLMAACRGTNCYKCRRKFWGKVVE